MEYTIKDRIVEVQKEIEAARNNLHADRMDMSLGEIMHAYEDGDLIINPEFQRFFRWTDEQQTHFIESILLGIPVPPIVVAESKESGKWELVDGLQRLSTVFSFFGILRNMREKNDWRLCEGDIIKSLAGLSREDLPYKLQLNIKRAVCRIEIIRWDGKYDMRYVLFNRLNKNGISLTDQEIRNAVFRGTSARFNDFLKRVAANEDFLTLIAPTEKQVAELYPEELVLRFVSLYKSVQVTENISEYMSTFMKKAAEDEKFDYSIEKLFFRVINLLKPLGKKVFLGPREVLSTNYYDVITVGIAHYIDAYEKMDTTFIESKIAELQQNNEFQETFGTGSDSVTRINKRLEVARSFFKI